ILLFVIGLHMVRTFFSGSYKRPRELNWVTGVGLFVLVLAMAITGAFLPWDQAAYWTAVVVTNIAVYTPFIGSFLRALWRGADTVGPTTLSRTFGIHVFILAVAIGAPLEAVADPATTSYTPVPEWFFLPLDELLLLVPQQLIPLVLVLPTGGVLLLLALPFIDRDAERNPFERPAVM